jgi:hypothetical protein
MVYPNLGNKTEKALAEFLGLQKGDPFPENYHRAPDGELWFRGVPIEAIIEDLLGE